MPLIPEKVYPHHLQRAALRRDRLESLSDYNKIRKMQLKAKLEDKKATGDRIIKANAENGLQWDVLFSGNQAFTLYRSPHSKDTERFRLGRGSFGSVLLGQDIDTGEWVAIKLFLENNEESKSSIIRENETLESLGLLVSALENASVMKLAYGSNLSNSLFDEEGHRRPMSPHEKLALCLDLVKNLQHLHDAKFIHCDLKLENMMWDPKTQKSHIIDVGLAQKMDLHGQYVTSSQMGTLGYMAFEIVNPLSKGHVIYSRQSDNYALGLVLAMILSDKSKNDIFDTTLGRGRGFYLDHPALTPDGAPCPPQIAEKIATVFSDVLSPNESGLPQFVASLLDVNPQNRPDSLIALIDILERLLKLTPDESLEEPAASATINLASKYLSTAEQPLMPGQASCSPADIPNIWKLALFKDSNILELFISTKNNKFYADNHYGVPQEYLTFDEAVEALCHENDIATLIKNSDLIALPPKAHVESTITFKPALKAKISSVEPMEFSANELHLFSELLSTSLPSNLEESLARISQDAKTQARIPLDGDDNVKFKNEITELHASFSKMLANKIAFSPDERIIMQNTMEQLQRLKDGDAFTMMNVMDFGNILVDARIKNLTRKFDGKHLFENPIERSLKTRSKTLLALIEKYYPTPRASLNPSSP